MINRVIEIKGILEYLEKRNLVNQYKKAKNFLLDWKLDLIDFKKRKPKTSKIYQFKINNKFRAFGYFEVNNKNTFRIIEISDHQD